MIKILHILATLDKGSGVANVVMNYYRNIDKNRIQFDFLYFVKTEKNYIKEIEKNGGNVFFMEKPSIRGYKKYKNFIHGFFSKHEGTYSAIHLHEAYLNLFVFPVAKKYGIKNCISHVHTTKYSDKKLNSLRNRILCFPLRKQATILMACSKAAGAFYYGSRAIKEKKIIVLNNAILCNIFRFNPTVRENYRQKLKIENKLVVGHVGRFNEQKNHLFLISIFKKVLERNPESVLLLIGNGKLKNMIKKEVIRAGLEDQVLFLGERNDVPYLMQAMDVFILPSLFEGLPVSGIEAQASGLPCVFSDTITREVSINDVLYLGLHEKPEIWAENVYKMALNNIEKNRIIGEVNVKKAGYDIEIQSQLLENFYQKLN